MKVEAEVNEMYKFVAQNSCTARGCYFGEDDWQVTEYANSLEGLIPKVSKSILDSEIHIYGWYMYSLRVLLYGEKSFDLEDTIIDITKSVPDFLSTVCESDEYKKLKKIQDDKKKLKVMKEKEKELKDQEKEERKTFERLKKKYEE
jgi:hypothetical protein